MVARLLLSVQDACVSFGDKKLFENLSFNITEGDKICLVGKNGAGKTTLMNIITGTRDLDDGTRWQLQGMTIGYLQQDITPTKGQSVYDFVFSQFSTEEQIEANAYKVDMVLHPLGLDPLAKMDKLSGGQLRRAAMARALVEEPDILLLDEPTNHLDLDVIEWLEGMVRGYHGAVVCISHDKAFLNTISDKVFWLDRGALKVCPFGFSRFDEWSTMILDQEARTLHNREKALLQELEWASRGVKARRKRNQRRLELVKSERDKFFQDKGEFLRMMAKIEISPIETEVSSKIVAEFFKVKKGFNDDGREVPILDQFSLRIMRGDRIGILGRNGSGKTTFLRLLTGELEPDAGKVKMSREIEFSYFDQTRRDLVPEWSLWKTLAPDGGDHVNVRGKARHVCGYLKDFMFDPSMALQPVSTLSGGQKNRLMLARVLADPKSFLILDEPTNDLDMDTLDMLEETLAEYQGTLIIVSHDRDFLDQTVTKILAFEGDGKIEGYIGGYSDYLVARAERKARMGEGAEAAKRADKKESGTPQAVEAEATAAKARMSYKLQYELDNLPKKIAALETEIDELQDRLADPDLYQRDPGAFENMSRRLPLAQADLDHAETRWLELEAMRAESV
ncbi:ABC-F family ATP-binding cassette domain-containing protein [Micavibrio aeruginosavorus]|uniref:ABC-F family ATP-binding cassette domain-containing protein n=1 Tax=Micavibrio aeruginosavorus TaxID=349221 RepID=UPI003F4A9A9B